MIVPYISQCVQFVPEQPIRGVSLFAAMITRVNASEGTVSLMALFPDGGSVVVHDVKQAVEPTYGYWNIPNQK